MCHCRTEAHNLYWLERVCRASFASTESSRGAQFSI